MRRAVALARRGLGYTSPNPPVGAVVVSRGRIVGEGFHRKAGGPHGEIHALNAAGTKARGATLYVTLEPCNHHGRTPPCTEAVIAAGVRRVVIGSRDPNPAVRGGGTQRLRRAGIDVTAGILQPECDDVIAAFRKRVSVGMPFVTLKLAASADGRIATRDGDSRWISSEDSRRYVHRLRAEHDAVMVGAQTVIADDPELTCRLRTGRNPLRIVVDGRLRIPATARVLTTEVAPTWIVTAQGSGAAKRKRLAAQGAEIIPLPAADGRTISLRALMAAIADRGISSVLLEGGAMLAAAAIAAGVVDRLLLFLAPKLIGGDGKPVLESLGIQKMADTIVLENLKVRRFSEDVLLDTQVSNRRAR